MASPRSGILERNIMNTWFTSDLHFGHYNIIRFCDRPFKDEVEMDRALIVNWNSKVQPNDTIYVLGDIFFCKMQRAANILDQLSGNKILVLGNHDKVIRNNWELKNKFADILPDLSTQTIQGQKVVLCHYPLWSWEHASRGVYNLHGHVHSVVPVQPNKRQYDVGVDNNGFFPVEWSEIVRKMEKIPVTPF